ncbi:RHTO0S04e11518g1_1 [Rhodotorula toruloides]|uniref:RHTO0S04e11518g1_1 n=2 Tax=Rhodotorula toruloides TaxID=5286 RepID=A0A061AYR9_RHOTO|nr:sulfate transporter [Rhodotorula toruloides NP11]EMS18409.1 sulfate transporter [Rhodotorula toruloides NP11]CDR39887.1 RHTO0S04e11518g1_1 [Rhodotorula toruloides]
MTRSAFATLPERLSQAAEWAQKCERVEEDLTRWQLLYRRARYYIPVLQWLPHYSLKSFMRDVIAALTLTSLIAPQSMSYATNLVHTDPVHGLFGAPVPAMIYLAMGTCRQLSVGPEAALSLITGETIAKFIEEEEHAHGRMSDAHRVKFIAKIITVIAFESGLLTFLLGYFRLGFLDAVLSRVLLRGFMAAVAVTIFVSTPFHISRYPIQHVMRCGSQSLPVYMGLAAI